MKRIIAVSDTHNKHFELNKDLDALGYEEETIFIHAGDCTNSGTPGELVKFLNWLGALNYKYKIFIAGNHDFCFENPNLDNPPIYPDIAQEFKDMGIIYLMDQMIEIDGIKIYGSPWQPRFYDWAFNLNRGEQIAQKWKLIPENLDILLTHSPPYGILDDTYGGRRVGCEELYKKIVSITPKIHIFGHIHYGRGYKDFNGTSFFNAASMGENYLTINKPIVIILDDDNDIIDINV